MVSILAASYPFPTYPIMLALQLRRRHVAAHAEGNHESHTSHGGDGITRRHARTLGLAVLIDLAQRRAFDLLEGGRRVCSIVVVVVGMSAAGTSSLAVSALHLLIAAVSTMITLRYFKLLHVRLEAEKGEEGKRA